MRITNPLAESEERNAAVRLETEIVIRALLG